MLLPLLSHSHAALDVYLALLDFKHKLITDNDPVDGQRDRSGGSRYLTDEEAPWKRNALSPKIGHACKSFTLGIIGHVANQMVAHGHSRLLSQHRGVFIRQWHQDS